MRLRDNDVIDRNKLRWSVAWLVCCFGLIVLNVLTYPPVFNGYRFTVLVLLIAVSLNYAFVIGADDTLNKISKDLYGIVDAVRKKP
jgi:hypothetical protein